MSDNITPIEIPVRKPPGIFEYNCERPGCRRLGRLGLSGRPRYGWFCYEHREDGER